MSEPSAQIYDAARLAAVRHTGLLDTAAEDAFDGLAGLAGTLLDAPFAFVTLVDDRRSFWKSCIGVPTDDVSARQNLVEESFCQYVVESGEALIVGDVRTNPITANNPSIESMGVAAWAGFPLLSPDGYVLGTFCVVDTVIRTWSERDVDVLRVLSTAASRELALRDAVRRAQAALQERDDALVGLQRLTARVREANSRLRENLVHDKAVSRSLQKAMLTRLPEPDHLHVTARYLTADEADEVGGDWYDAIVPPSGATTLMIGDVSGHNIAAATVMGQLRNMLRAFAWDRPSDTPARLIARLDAAMSELDIARMATLLVARIEQGPDDEANGLRTVRWSSAGHPPPVLIGPDGDVTVLHARPDPPIGVSVALSSAGRTWRRTDHTQRIPADSTLVLYTDGLVEARDVDIDVRQRDLTGQLAEHHAKSLDDMLDAMLEHMLDGARSDDVAVLAVRFHPEDEPRPVDAP